jgi:hypothetical protein
MSGFRNQGISAGTVRNTHREENGWSSDEETVSDQPIRVYEPVKQREPEKQKPFIPAKPSFDKHYNIAEDKPKIEENKSHDPFVNQPQKPRAQSFGQSTLPPLARLNSTKQPSLSSVSSFQTVPVPAAPVLSPLSSLAALNISSAPSTHTATHTINPDEHASFVAVINDLPAHPHLTHLPINPTNPDLYLKIQGPLALSSSNIKMALSSRISSIQVFQARLISAS